MTGNVGRLPEVAAELARLDVDVIVPINTPAAQAVKQATEKIPIVFVRVADLAGSDLVQILRDPDSTNGLSNPQPGRASTCEIEDAAKHRVGALMVIDGVAIAAQHTSILELAREKHLPVVSQFREFVEGGGLMAYGPSLSARPRRRSGSRSRNQSCCGRIK